MTPNILLIASGQQHWNTLVEDRYKITVHYRKPYGELYDLQEDPEAEPLWMPRVAGA